MASKVVASPHEPGVYYIGADTWQVGSRYEIRKVLGSGSFSAVCLAWDKVEGEKVALKRVGDVFASPDYAKRVLREVCIMRRLQHPNIIHLKDVFLKPSPTGKYVFRGGRLVPTSFDCYIAMECCDQGDLFNMRGQLPEHEVRSLMWQLLSALRYLHGLNVWHRDIKTSNVLLTLSEGRRLLKVADFGSARSAKNGCGSAATAQCGGGDDGGTPPPPYGDGGLGADTNADMEAQGPDITAARPPPAPASAPVRRRASDGAVSAPPLPRSALVAVPAANGGYEPPLTSLVCTPCYRAPEVVMSRGNYNSAIDMWSAGCVLGELLQRVAYVGKASTPHLQVAPVFAVSGKPLTPRTGQRYGAAEPEASAPSGRGAAAASAYAELSALFAVIGTPSWACIEGVRSEAWRRYLFHVPGRAPTLHRRFGQAGEVAVDLLSRLLQFDPARRAGAEEAMAHEYFAMMHMEAQMAAADLAAHAESGARAVRDPATAAAAGPAAGAPQHGGRFWRDSASLAEAAEPEPLPTWPPGRPSSRHASAAGTPGGPADMEVEGGGAPLLAGRQQQQQQQQHQQAQHRQQHHPAAGEDVAVRRFRSCGGVSGRESSSGAGGSLLTKRKQLEEPVESRGGGGGGGGEASRHDQQQREREPLECREVQQGLRAPWGLAGDGAPNRLSFWQIEEPALALAALEAELAELVPPDTPTSSAAAALAAPGAAAGPRAATAAQSPEALAFVERVKDRLREMLERECQEHAATTRRCASAEAQAGPSAGGGGGGTGSAGAAGAPAAGMGYVRRINSDGAMVGPDGQLLQASGVAAALHGHLRPDPGSQLDPSVIGYERIPYHADAAAARLEPEKHLWAGRHGEWTQSSLAAQRREQGAGTWGVTLLPPGMDEATAAGQAFMDVVRSQHAR